MHFKQYEILKRKKKQMHHKSYQPLCVFVCVGEMFMYILLCMCGWKTEIGLSISFHYSISLLNASWPSNSKDGPDIITLNQFLKYRQMPSIWLLLQCWGHKFANKLFIHWQIFPALVTHSTLILRNQKTYPLASQKISLCQGREILNNRDSEHV